MANVYYKIGYFDPRDNQWHEGQPPSNFNSGQVSIGANASGQQGYYAPGGIPTRVAVGFGPRGDQVRYNYQPRQTTNQPRYEWVPGTNGNLVPVRIGENSPNTQIVGYETFVNSQGVPVQIPRYAPVTNSAVSAQAPRYAPMNNSALPVRVGRSPEGEVYSQNISAPAPALSSAPAPAPSFAPAPAPAPAPASAPASVNRGRDTIVLPDGGVIRNVNGVWTYNTQPNTSSNAQQSQSNVNRQEVPSITPQTPSVSVEPILSGQSYRSPSAPQAPSVPTESSVNRQGIPVAPTPVYQPSPIYQPSSVSVPMEYSATGQGIPSPAPQAPSVPTESSINRQGIPQGTSIIPSPIYNNLADRILARLLVDNSTINISDLYTVEPMMPGTLDESTVIDGTLDESTVIDGTLDNSEETATPVSTSTQENDFLITRGVLERLTQDDNLLPSQRSNTAEAEAWNQRIQREARIRMVEEFVKDFTMRNGRGPTRDEIMREYPIWARERSR